MRTLLHAICTGLVFICAWAFFGMAAWADEPFVVVIDPGHGGNNLGAEYGDYTEKDMTMTVAYAMQEELEKYDNVAVYLTHETDSDMSIKDRARFAKEKKADFLFCLHFNSSINHKLYGAEVWVSAFADDYVKGRQFGEICLDSFSKMGLFHRGVKTRLNHKGENYYGILRYCTEQGIPAALIEHCHLDNEKDVSYYSDEESLKKLGRADAEAAAKYFGLSSTEKGVDYSDFPKTDVPKASVVKPDETEPDICEIEILDIDEKEGLITVAVNAQDYDSYIQYYCYSTNGGNTYSELFGWPRPAWDSSENEYLFTVQLPFEEEIEFRAAVYNGFDLFHESNIIMIPAIPKGADAAEGAPDVSMGTSVEGEGVSGDSVGASAEGALGTFAGASLESAAGASVGTSTEDTAGLESGTMSKSLNENGNVSGTLAEPLKELTADSSNASIFSEEGLKLLIPILLICLLMACLLVLMFKMLFQLKGHSKKRK